jgi:hypothetical protein
MLVTPAPPHAVPPGMDIREEELVSLGIIFAGVFCLVVGVCDWFSGFTGPLEGLFTGGIALLFFGAANIWYRDRQEKKQKAKEAKAEGEAHLDV